MTVESGGGVRSAQIAPAVESTFGQPWTPGLSAYPKATRAARAQWRVRYIVMLCLVDFLVGLGSAAAALQLRFSPTTGHLYDQNYLWVTLALPFAWSATLALNRAYEARHLFVGGDEYARVFRSGLGLTAALAFVSFSFGYPLARGYVIMAMPLATIGVVVSRYVARKRLHRAWGRGDRLRRVILVGHEVAVADMARQLRRERYHGLGVIGACLPHLPVNAERPVNDDDQSINGTGNGRRTSPLPPIYGTFDEIAGAVQRAVADTVVVLSCPEIDGAALRRLAWRLEGDDIDLIVASTLVDVAGDRTTVRPVDGLPMLHIEHPRLRGGGRLIKAAFDRVVALMLLILGAPVLLGIAALIRLAPCSGGPAIFRQERVGKDGRRFVMYKFRTMYRDAESRIEELYALNESDGELFKIRDDPRVTPIGRWLRRLSIDEIPQLINVAKGDMSLVGPRPPLAREVASYPADMRRRLVVKPGLTGLWQVSGRSDLSWEESMRLDLSYVENWSLAMDLVILARTVMAVLRSSGAY
jgi:exopolysaccharide biosynthesis polyprenyl glycosylphosphotransferase